MHYKILYPFAEGIRDYFSNDVVGAIHIGIDMLSITGPE
jgi:hypothetical protein